ncbi:hypothetical protein [Herpetosiphon sp.]|uniref:hypothetical protein n=1 Tax=Herpetosiphon sp. TaxID=71864 RepID=UPI00257CBC0D|nr:hypothetical protein [Herpetosiphon sp.]
MQPLEVVRKWRGIQVNERRAFYEHFTDLCSLVGAKTPLEEDPITPLKRGFQNSMEEKAGPMFGKKAILPLNIKASMEILSVRMIDSSSIGKRC